MHKIKKKVCAFCSLLVVCVLLFGVVFGSFANATYYSEHAYDTEALYFTKLLYQAVEKCMTENNMFKDGANSRTEVNFSTHVGGDDDPLYDTADPDNDDNDRDKFREAGRLTLFTSKYLFTEDETGRFYSGILEDYAADLVNDDYNNRDEKLWCVDRTGFNHIAQLMKRLFGSFTANRINELICNDAYNGFFSITAGWKWGNYKIVNPYTLGMHTFGAEGATLDHAYIGNGSGTLVESFFPEEELGDGTHCKRNLDFFHNYQNTNQQMSPVWFDTNGDGMGDTESDFVMVFDWGPESLGYFRQYIRRYFGATNMDINIGKADNYWRSYGTFDSNKRCIALDKGVLGLTASATNMIGVYDANDRLIYYLDKNKIQANSKHYYLGTNDGQRTCSEFAKDLGADYDQGGINEDRVKEIIIATDQGNIDSCVQEFDDAVSRYREYAQEYSSLIEMASKFTHVVQDVYSGMHGYLNDMQDDGEINEDSWSLIGVDSPLSGGSHNFGGIMRSLKRWITDIDEGIGEGDEKSRVFSNAFDLLVDEVSAILDDDTKIKAKANGEIESIVIEDGEGFNLGDKLAGIYELLELANGEVSDNEEALSDLNGILDKYYVPSFEELHHFGDINSVTVWEAHVDATNATNSEIVCVGYDAFKAEVDALSLPNPPHIEGWTHESSGHNEDEEPPEDGRDKCYDNAGEFGYWECGVINQMAATVGGMDELLGQWLSVDNDLVSRDSDAFKLWQIFRSFANMAIVIVLLVIIFSQLTGVGIDNYGIKKMLPKLIIVAVLINLSHVLCELAIDVSNILGNGLTRMFESMGKTVGAGSEFLQGTAALVLSVFAGGGMAAGSILSIIDAGNGAMLAVMIIMALIPVVVAILLFFAAIGARMAIVIVCTVISPLAVVLYVLPNTQGLFKKYINIFKTALVVYPICGALYGIGYVIRAIMYGNGEKGFGGLLIAIVAPYLAFFALPMLTKGALSALGVMGAALTSMGSNIRGGISKGTSAVQQSEFFKNAMEDSREQRGYKRASGFAKRIEKKYGKEYKAENLKPGERRRLARAQDTMRAYDAKKRDVEFKSSSDYGSIRDAEEFEKDVANETRLLSSKTHGGADGEKLNELYKAYVESNNKAGAVAVARMASRRADTAGKFLDYVKKNGKEFGGNDAFNATMKEVSEGTNSASYRKADGLGFEWASQLNRGGEKGTAETDYSEWRTPGNITKAINNHMSSGDALMGLQKDAMNELNEAMDKGKMRAEDAANLRTWATERIGDKYNQGSLVRDKEKAEAFAAMSGAYEYKNGKYLPKDGSGDGGTPGGGAMGGSSGGNRGVAAEGENFRVRQGAAGNVSDEALLEVATAPGVASNVAAAAEREYLRRNPNFNNDSDARRSNSRGATGNRGGYVPE